MDPTPDTTTLWLHFPNCSTPDRIFRRPHAVTGSALAAWADAILSEHSSPDTPAELEVWHCDARGHLTAHTLAPMPPRL